MRPEAPAFPTPTDPGDMHEARARFRARLLTPESSPVISNPSQGVKFDADKLPWDLLPWDAVEEVVKVLAFGAKKYAPRNWEKGITHSRTFAATQRHLVAWFQRGEDLDPETGLDHRAHAICELAFSLAFSLRAQDGQEIALPDGGTGPLDDRPRVRDTERPPAASEAEPVQGQPPHPFTPDVIERLCRLGHEWWKCELSDEREIDESILEIVRKACRTP
jgi:hypothetical protein